METLIIPKFTKEQLEELEHLSKRQEWRGLVINKQIAILFKDIVYNRPKVLKSWTKEYEQYRYIHINKSIERLNLLLVFIYNNYEKIFETKNGKILVGLCWYAVRLFNKNGYVA